MPIAIMLKFFPTEYQHDNKGKHGITW